MQLRSAIVKNKFQNHKFFELSATSKGTGKVFKRGLKPDSLTQKPAQQIDPDEGIEKDEKEFRQYFRSQAIDGNEINLEKFMQYPKIQEWIKDYKVISEDIEEIWKEFAIEKNTVDINDGYEIVCMAQDIPDPDTQIRWEKSYKSLTKRRQSLTFAKLSEWLEIRDLLEKGEITTEELKQFYDDEVNRNSGTDSLSLESFLRINRRIDFLLDEKEEQAMGQPIQVKSSTVIEITTKPSKLELASETTIAPAATVTTSIPTIYNTKEEPLLIETESNIWKKSFDPREAFDTESLFELQEAYKSLLNTENMISYDAFMEWLKEEGFMDSESDSEKDTEQQVQSILQRATQFNNNVAMITNFDTFLRLNVEFEILYNDDDSDSNSNSKQEIIDDHQETEDDSEEYEDEEGEEDAASFYIEEYAKLLKVSKSSLLSYETLIQWEEIQSLLNSKLITERQLQQMYNSFIQRQSKNNKNGLTENNFLAFNDLLDVYIENNEDASKNNSNSNSNSNSNNNNQATTVQTSGKVQSTTEESRPEKIKEVPIGLVSEKALPLPKDSQQSMFPPPTTSTSTSTIETSTTNEEEETRLFEVFDKAESLLAQRSFSTFNELIGDADELLAETGTLNKEMDTGLTSTSSTGITQSAAAIKNAQEADRLLQSLKQELLAVAINRYTKEPNKLIMKNSEQEENEEDIVQIRSLFQQICDILPATSEQTLAQKVTQQIAALPTSSSALISTTINVMKFIAPRLVGSWRLLFTNSDMMSFYNGVSGFANIIPGGTVFQGLQIDVIYDGYINEIQYLEDLKVNILGLKELQVQTFANFEIIKEISFMTNEDTVVLRNYVNKVQAGPFTYKAEDNWKSLRSFAMNELVYLDDDLLLMRNAGALRVFFIFQRVQ
jgi:polyhydroxyalkanoate synthesis regulator phasin